MLYFLIGITEISIGLSTLLGVAFFQATGTFGISPKPLNVYIFVVSTAAMSFILGVGMLAKREWARKLLIFFSGYIILTKLLRFTGLMTFSGDIVTIVPSWTRDAVSAGYHLFLVICLSFCRPSK